MIKANSIFSDLFFTKYKSLVLKFLKLKAIFIHCYFKQHYYSNIFDYCPLHERDITFKTLVTAIAMVTNVTSSWTLTSHVMALFSIQIQTVPTFKQTSISMCIITANYTTRSNIFFNIQAYFFGFFFFTIRISFLITGLIQV